MVRKQKSLVIRDRTLDILEPNSNLQNIPIELEKTLRFDQNLDIEKKK